MMSSKMPWPRYCMKHIVEPALYGLICSAKPAKVRSARSDATTRAAARPGRLPRRPAFYAHGGVPPGLDRYYQ